MPAIYAHNKFGKEVLKSMDEECREIIRKYPNQYRIGLQGPDYLFFYLPYIPNSIKDLGYNMHAESAKGFFENGVNIIKDKGKDSGYFAYLLGFTCHFALDSECHPYIAQAIGETGVGHIELESEYDRHLMSGDGHNPLKYPVWKLVPTDSETAQNIAEFYGEITVKNAKSALRQMKFVKRVLMPNKIKEQVCELLFRLTTHYVDLKGHIIKQKTNEKCQGTNKRLDELFCGAKDIAAELIENLTACIDNGTELSDRFDRNFK